MNVATFGFSVLSLMGLLLAAGLLLRLPPGPASATTVLVATVLTAVLTHLIAVSHRVDRLSRDA